MTVHDQGSLSKFRIRDLHPNVFIGMASDRYAGWIGQIYSEDRYKGQITRRTHTVGGKAFIEEVLPGESVEEYFEHFPVLEIDYTFYRLLLEKDGKPTQNYHVLRKYRGQMKEGDSVILKVPQVIFARRLGGEGDLSRMKPISIRRSSPISSINPPWRSWGRPLTDSSLSRNIIRKRTV